jgi:RNA polymerase sigma-70 factor (ECF subfamily)
MAYSEAQFLDAYDRHADEIFRFSYYKVLDRDRAKDVVQEVFLRTWEYIRKGKEVGNIRAFLYRVANNIIVDDFRKKHEYSLTALQEDGFDIPVDTREHFLTKDEVERLEKHMEALHVAYREVIVLRYVNELSVKEMAALLGETENNVSVRLHRAISALKKRAQPAKKV